METNKHEGVTVTLPLNRYLELTDKEAELDARKEREGKAIGTVLDDVDGHYYWREPSADPFISDYEYLDQKRKINERTREKNAEVLAMVMALDGARNICIYETLDAEGERCGYNISMQVGRKDAR